jgi:cytochrome c oxidase assembly protein subunit 15
MLFPPMVGGVLFEHGHRMIAGAVATLTLVLAVWTWREEPRRSIRILAALALGAVLLQALLGGITVLFLLPTAVSVAHACLAQTFFCLVVALAVVTGRGWLSAEPVRTPSALPAIAAGTTAIVYVQLVVGAVMRHTGAGLAIPDFPLAFGRVVPDFASPEIAVHFAHRIGALGVTVAAAATFADARLRHADEPRLLRPATLLGCLVLLQIGLGATTIWTRMAVVPTTAHVANGAAVLATSLVLALRARRLSARERLPAAIAEGVAA